MSPFRFRLGSLESFRRQTRQQCQLELAAADAALRRLQARIGQLDAQMRQLQHSVRHSTGPGRVDVVRLAATSDFERQLRAQRDRLVQQEMSLGEEISRRRDALVEADRDMRTLEMLRERQHEEHRMGEQRNEAKLLDDAAARGARKRSA